MTAHYSSKHGQVAKRPEELYMAFTDLRNFAQMVPMDKVQAAFESVNTVGPASEEPAAAASEEPAAAASEEPAASGEPASDEAASAEAPAAEEAAAPAAANPNYDPFAHSWASIEIVMVIVIIVVGAVLMLSFGKKKID